MDSYTPRQIVDFLTPKSLSMRLVRIGGFLDGGYLIPDDLKGVQHCFSPGVDNRKRFEDDLVRNYGINTHLADFSSSVDQLHTPLVPGRQTFIKKWLGGTSGGDVIGLADWVDQIGVRQDEDLMLQMDVEGAENEIFRTVPPGLLERFRIIVLELHNLDQLASRSWTANCLGRLAKQLDPLFVSVHLHPNNCCRIFHLDELDLDLPRVVELTLLRRDRINEAFTPHEARAQVPHQRDIWFNQIDNPPLHLSKKWFAKGRSLPSKIRIVLDWLFYGVFGFWVRRLPSGVRASAARLKARVRPKPNPSI